MVMEQTTCEVSIDEFPWGDGPTMKEAGLVFALILQRPENSINLRSISE